MRSVTEEGLERGGGGNCALDGDFWMVNEVTGAEGERIASNTEYIETNDDRE